MLITAIMLYFVVATIWHSKTPSVIRKTSERNEEPSVFSIETVFCNALKSTFYHHRAEIFEDDVAMLSTSHLFKSQSDIIIMYVYT